MANVINFLRKFKLKSNSLTSVTLEMNHRKQCTREGSQVWFFLQHIINWIASARTTLVVQAHSRFFYFKPWVLSEHSL
jgi:hypothetical protein